MLYSKWRGLATCYVYGEVILLLFSRVILVKGDKAAIGTTLCAWLLWNSFLFCVGVVFLGGIFCFVFHLHFQVPTCDCVLPHLSTTVFCDNMKKKIPSPLTSYASNVYLLSNCKDVFVFKQMIKRNINNARRMASHPTLPYCELDWLPLCVCACSFSLIMKTFLPAQNCSLFCNTVYFFFNSVCVCVVITAYHAFLPSFNFLALYCFRSHRCTRWQCSDVWVGSLSTDHLLSTSRKFKGHKDTV